MVSVAEAVLPSAGLLATLTTIHTLTEFPAILYILKVQKLLWAHILETPIHENYAFTLHSSNLISHLISQEFKTIVLFKTDQSQPLNWLSVMLGSFKYE